MNIHKLDNIELSPDSIVETSDKHGSSQEQLSVLLWNLIVEVQRLRNEVDELNSRTHSLRKIGPKPKEIHARLTESQRQNDIFDKVMEPKDRQTYEESKSGTFDQYDEALGRLAEYRPNPEFIEGLLERLKEDNGDSRHDRLGSGEDLPPSEPLEHGDPSSSS